MSILKFSLNLNKLNGFSQLVLITRIVSFTVSRFYFYFFVRYTADNHIKMHTCGRKKRNPRQNDIR